MPRTGPRRAGPVVLTPTYKTAELPPWSPSAPRTGWTPSSAWDAALDYADAQEDIYDERTLATAAYRALIGAVPGLHRADVVERIHGVSARYTYLNPETYNPPTF